MTAMWKIGRLAANRRRSQIDPFPPVVDCRSSRSWSSLGGQERSSLRAQLQRQRTDALVRNRFLSNQGPFSAVDLTAATRALICAAAITVASGSNLIARCLRTRLKISKRPQTDLTMMI
jgi:hypothetical protein